MRPKPSEIHASIILRKLSMRNELLYLVVFEAPLYVVHLNFLAATILFNEFTDILSRKMLAGIYINGNKLFGRKRMDLNTAFNKRHPTT